MLTLKNKIFFRRVLQIFEGKKSDEKILLEFRMKLKKRISENSIFC